MKHLLNILGILFCQNTVNIHTPYFIYMYWEIKLKTKITTIGTL